MCFLFLPSRYNDTNLKVIYVKFSCKFKKKFHDFSCLDRQKIRKMKKNSYAVDNVLKVLILFIGFFMTQITFSIYMSRITGYTRMNDTDRLLV